MLDINLFRKEPEKVKDILEKRNMAHMLPEVDYVVRLDREWRDALKQNDVLRAQRNKVAVDMPDEEVADKLADAINKSLHVDRESVLEWAREKFDPYSMVNDMLSQARRK